jgi:Domain of unknown function (DUF6471)
MSGDGEEQWAERTKRFIKAELKRADVTYEQLAERLSAMGFTETKASIANKVSRGTFSAAFLIASLKAVECRTLRVDDV